MFSITIFLTAGESVWLSVLVLGSDFIKTSTGKLSIGSSRQACYVMLKSVLDFESMTGVKAGIKVAGGIRDAKDAIRYLVMINEEMGSDWLNPELFRFGASSLLDDVLKRTSCHAV